MLLEEFEESRAIIEPTDQQIKRYGQVCDTLILSFNGKIIERIRQMSGVRKAGFLQNLNGENPWYLYEEDGHTVAVMMAPIGAPMVVGQLEELAAHGFKNFIIFGTCGVLDRSIAADKIILPEYAIRDEGTSYHYAAAGDEIAYDSNRLGTLEAIFDVSGIEHIRTKTWTTDAFYRETAAKVKRRLSAGAQVVEMEAASIMAWSQFRKTKVYQFFYTADYLDHHRHEWDTRRKERRSDVMAFFDIAMTIAKAL